MSQIVDTLLSRGGKWREVLGPLILHHEGARHAVESVGKLGELRELRGLGDGHGAGGAAAVGHDGQLVALRLLAQEAAGVSQHVAVNIEDEDSLDLANVPSPRGHLPPQLLELLLPALLHLDDLEVEHPARTLEDVEDVEVLVQWSGQHDGESLPARHGSAQQGAEPLDDGGLVGERGHARLQHEPVEEESLGGGEVLVGEEGGVPDAELEAGEVVAEGGGAAEGSLQRGVLRGLAGGEAGRRVLRYYEVTSLGPDEAGG